MYKLRTDTQGTVCIAMSYSLWPNKWHAFLVASLWITVATCSIANGLFVSAWDARTGHLDVGYFPTDTHDSGPTLCQLTTLDILPLGTPRHPSEFWVCSNSILQQFTNSNQIVVYSSGLQFEFRNQMMILEVYIDNIIQKHCTITKDSIRFQSQLSSLVVAIRNVINCVCWSWQ